MSAGGPGDAAAPAPAVRNNGAAASFIPPADSTLSIAKLKS